MLLSAAVGSIYRWRLFCICKAFCFGSETACCHIASCEMPLPLIVKCKDRNLNIQHLPISLFALRFRWFFAMISISGVFAVTFSVVFAYVADVTDESERSAAYGLVCYFLAFTLVLTE